MYVNDILENLSFGQPSEKWLFGLSYATDRIIRDETLIDRERYLAIFVNCF